MLTSGVIDSLFWGAFKRYPVVDRLREFRRNQWDDRSTFLARQNDALGSLLGHALRNVPLYRDRGSGVTSDDAEAEPRAALAALPILEKSDISARAAALTVEIGRRSYADRTGGSTGEPVTVIKDSVSQSAALAAEVLFREWVGVREGDRVVKLWGARRDVDRGGASKGRPLADRIWNRLTLNAFEMSDATMREYVEAIDRFRPACLEGYADALHELALFMERSSLSFAAPRAVVSSASTLHAHMRDRLESVIGAPVFDRYGTREVGGIASECDRHSGLHVFGETMLVEVVGDDGRPARQGDEGDVLVTSLWNYTMPLIRYRIGDRAVVGGDSCGCGRPYPLLERVVGRSDACFRLRRGGIVPPGFFIHVIGVELNDGSIEKFQVLQNDWDDLTIRVVPSDRTTAGEEIPRDRIASRIREATGEDTRIAFVVEERIEPTPTGKHRYVISKVAGDGA